MLDTILQLGDAVEHRGVVLAALDAEADTLDAAVQLLVRQRYDAGRRKRLHYESHSLKRRRRP